MRRTFALSLTAGIALGLAGCRANPPSNFETKTVVFAKHHIFIGNKREHNPLMDNTQTRTDGKEAFSHYCVACHGMDGQNTGVPFIDHISPPIPSLASPEVQSYTDGQLKWILDNGIWPSGMPGSKGTLSDDELWSIVVYLRHLPPIGSQGTPDMYTH
ncbi:c-type cytochrome [Granulicella sp. 5B5]|uniref:c-type cytochrome n=1 Tax=Granulicella sp. 5B5 TaxID=1617967 RepID=UPI0015F56E46|nr:c-type cytochrome [Granulicella sp. 5B5]QMV20019.1 c-type cytochrome [Granulicella sp. 5B5]